MTCNAASLKQGIKDFPIYIKAKPTDTFSFWLFANGVQLGELEQVMQGVPPPLPEDRPSGTTFLQSRGLPIVLCLSCRHHLVRV
jgi:hypothetical protein